MDTSKLVAGQNVTLYGCGYLKGVVVSTTPDGVVVLTDDGPLQFDNDGKETETSHRRRIGGPIHAIPEHTPWELVANKPNHD